MKDVQITPSTKHFVDKNVRMTSDSRLSKWLSGGELRSTYRLTLVKICVSKTFLLHLLFFLLAISIAYKLYIFNIIQLRVLRCH